MQDMGLKLTAEDIYSINRSSLKDAIVQFGGVHGELISGERAPADQPPLRVRPDSVAQQHGQDILKDGFWAMSKDEELMNPGLTAMFIVRIEDVTDSVQAARAIGPDEEKALRERPPPRPLMAQDTRPSSDFLYGNQQFLVTKTYTDVRLVGAPPSAIGKYGGDTDNWVWPRHTGDSHCSASTALRWVAGRTQRGQCALPRPTTFPCRCTVWKNDFTVVFGFPGRGAVSPAAQVEHLIDVLNPTRIGMRTAGRGHQRGHARG